MALISNGTTVASGGALIGAGGDYTHITSFDGSTGVNIQNCFSSTYDSYMVLVKRVIVTNEFRMRFLTTGTTQFTSSVYDWSNVIYTGGYNSYNTGQAVICSTNTQTVSGSWTLFINKPNVSEETTWNGVGFTNANGSSQPYSGFCGGVVQSTTTFTGLRLYFGGNGSVLKGDVYGVKN